MRKEAALLAMLGASLVILPAPARAGTYDVVACNTAAGDGAGINRAWTIETYNRAGKAAPATSAFAIPPLQSCATNVGLSLRSSDGAASVRVDDGAGFVFRAPEGATVKDVTFWRYTQARLTSANASGPYWVSVARAGTSAGGSVILGGTSGADYCSGATAVYPAFCLRGANVFGTPGSGSTYTGVDQPVVSLGIECAAATPTESCATGAAPESHAGVQFQGAKVTVSDPTPPELTGAGPLEGWRRPVDPLPASATDASGIRTARVLVDGVERFLHRFDCDFHRPAPCPTSADRPFDLVGIADGRHTLTTVVEDAAGNAARSDRTIDLDGTPPVIDRVPVSGRRVSVRVTDALSGLAGGTIEVRDGVEKPYTALKTTLRSGRLTATVPRSLRMSRLGIRVSVSDKAGNAFSSVVTSMSLSTRVGKRARKVRNARASVPYGRPVQVLGRLTTTEGTPIANQPIVINGALRLAGATPQAIATARPIPAGASR